MLNAGRLDQRITLQARVASVSTRGEDAYTWSAGTEVWAQAEPLRGREFFAAAQTQAEVTVRFRIRYRTDVDATMRVLWRGEPYDIASPPIDPNGAREFLELMCLNGVGDGQ